MFSYIFVFIFYIFRNKFRSFHVWSNLGWSYNHQCNEWRRCRFWTGKFDVDQVSSILDRL